MGNQETSDYLTSGFSDWLKTGEYLQSANMKSAMQLAFLAGVKHGAEYIKKKAENVPAPTNPEIP